MLPRQRRSSTITEEEPTVAVPTKPGSVLLLTGPRHQALVARFPSIKKVFDTMSASNLEANLSAVPFIQRAGLTAPQRSVLGELGTYSARGPENEPVIFAQGADASSVFASFYIILHGSVDVFRETVIRAGDPDKLSGAGSAHGLRATCGAVWTAQRAARGRRDSPR
eukprot:5658287-Prymnesium_polylepis.1